MEEYVDLIDFGQELAESGQVPPSRFALAISKRTHLLPGNRDRQFAYDL